MQDLMDSVLKSQVVLEQFQFQRNEFLSSLDLPSSSSDPQKPPSLRQSLKELNSARLPPPSSARLSEKYGHGKNSGDRSVKHGRSVDEGGEREFKEFKENILCE